MVGTELRAVHQDEAKRAQSPLSSQTSNRRKRFFRSKNHHIQILGVYEGTDTLPCVARGVCPRSNWLGSNRDRHRRGRRSQSPIHEYCGLRGFGRFVMEFRLDAFKYKELEERLIGNVPFVC